MSMSDEEFEALHEEAHERLGWAAHIPEVIVAAMKGEEKVPAGQPLAVLVVFDECTIQMQRPGISLEDRASLGMRLIETTEEAVKTFEEHRLINSALN